MLAIATFAAGAVWAALVTYTAIKAVNTAEQAQRDAKQAFGDAAVALIEAKRAYAIDAIKRRQG